MTLTFRIHVNQRKPFNQITAKDRNKINREDTSVTSGGPFLGLWYWVLIYFYGPLTSGLISYPTEIAQLPASGDVFFRMMDSSNVCGDLLCETLYEPKGICVPFC